MPASRRGRLSRSAEFERVYRQGRSLGNRHLVLYAFPTATAERPRLGLSVSRKVGGAVHRNRVKRLLREAFAGMEPELAEGQDLVIVARPEVRDLAEREGLAGVSRALVDLLDRAGLRAGAAGAPAASNDVARPEAGERHRTGGGSEIPRPGQAGHDGAPHAAAAATDPARARGPAAAGETRPSGAR